MEKPEIARLLAYINSIDDRVSSDAIRIEGWKTILPPDLPYVDAMNIARQHYQESDRAIMPNLFCQKWKPTRPPIQYCGTCWNGWIEQPDDTLTPCPCTGKVLL